MANSSAGQGLVLFGAGVVAGALAVPVGSAASHVPTYEASVGTALRMSGESVVQSLDPARVAVVVLVALVLAVVVAANLIARREERTANTTRSRGQSPTRSV